MTSHKNSALPTLPYQTVTVLGDSHARFLDELVEGMVNPATTVNGICKPGARLLDIVIPHQRTAIPEPGPHCEILIAGTNDVAAKNQSSIYRYLEGFITSRPAGTDLIIATLPHRHDVKNPHHPIHDETDLVNAFIEELAIRHNIRVINLDHMNRRHFTRHGQHLTYRGKRVLAEMVVKSLSTTGRRPTTVKPSVTQRSTSAGAAIRPGDKTFAEAVIDLTTCDDVPAEPSPDNTSKNENYVFLGTPSSNDDQD